MTEEGLVPEISISAEAFLEYKRTVARHEPETCLLLGGSLDRPTHIERVLFCPPAKTDGRYDASPAHFSIDADLMNWIVLHDWEPSGWYMLGVWHSHPGAVSTPTGADGDLQFFKACLDRRAAIDAGWNLFLAPITTFDRACRDHIHPWVYRRGERDCTPASLVVIHEGAAYSSEQFAMTQAVARGPKRRRSRTKAEKAEAELVAYGEAKRRIMARSDLGWLSKGGLWRRMHELEKLAFRRIARQYGSGSDA